MLKTPIKLALLIGASVLLTHHASANLIVNGSFENTPGLNQGTWGLFCAGQVPGWDPVGTTPLEIGLGTTYGVTGYVGNNVMELDSTANVTVDQIVGTSGGSYTLSFLFARRNGVSSSSCSFDVYWNGGLQTSITPTSTAMSLFSMTVTGAALNTLEFRGTGASDSLGGILDDVQLDAAVPEPTTIIAGALLLLPFGASTLRILRKRQAV